jgi:hypothetical protein
MFRTRHELALDWGGDENDSLLMASLGHDEYLVARKPENAPNVWYWCAGDKSDLDANVCGFVPTKQEAIRYCERVAAWRATSRP